MHGTRLQIVSAGEQASKLLECHGVPDTYRPCLTCGCNERAIGGPDARIDKRFADLLRVNRRENGDLADLITVELPNYECLAAA